MSSNNSASSEQVFLVTIDGPAGVGKGTLAKQLARTFGFYYLDSGAVYRALAVQALKNQISLDDIDRLVKLSQELALTFPVEHAFRAYSQGQDIDDLLRTDECSQAASIIASYPSVRQELLSLQRRFRRAPGLVGDGRDLGTIVFPDAQAKIFLDASCEERAQRRYKQLIDQGISANFDRLFDSIRTRDERDRSRSTAPLIAAEGAWVIDSTELTIQDVVSMVSNYIEKQLSMSK